MTDDSNLDWIRTFIGKVHIAATVKHEGEVKDITKIDDPQRILIHNGISVAQFLNSYENRHEIEIEDTSETGLTSGLNNIINGINKLNDRKEISGYTKPPTLNRIEFVPRGEVENTTKCWRKVIEIDVKWETG